ncbi:MAG: DUF1059 domain-containing protein [Ilumatobacteraceae bacterium]
MKAFACGDVVPGCRATWLCTSEDELLAAVAAHARDDHGLTELPTALLEQVRSRILTSS